jgi:hypothetical protein
MQNLCELGMGDADLAAADRRHAPDSGVLERIAKGIFSDHSCGTNDYKALWACRRDVHARTRYAAKVLIVEGVEECRI